MYSSQKLKDEVRNNFYNNGECMYKKISDNFAYLLDTTAIFIDERNTFFVRTEFEYVMADTYNRLEADFRQKEITEADERAVSAYAYDGAIDHGHTSPNWENVFSLGIAGLKERADKYLCNTHDEEKEKFYSMVSSVYSSAIRFMIRCADKALEEGRVQMAQGLINLTKAPPSNLFEAMQLSLVYYTLQHNLEGVYLRTMGNLDRLLLPFYTDSKEACELCRAYITEINSYGFDSNIPFAICGTDMKGNDLTNAMSHHLLDAYRELSLPLVKIHILYSEKTDRTLVRKALDAIRNGANSIVFMNDFVVKKSLAKLGTSAADASEYAIVGCYEAMAKEEIPCTCNAKVSMPKALELALNDGCDMLTGEQIGIAGLAVSDFDELLKAFCIQLENLCVGAMEFTDRQERHYAQIMASPFISSTYESCMTKGRDVYVGYGAQYNNSSLNAMGLATTVDSLMGVKYMLSCDENITMADIRRILQNNWKNNEILRRKVVRNSPKYGNGNKDADRLASDILEFLSATVNGRPNAKGGVYRLGTFSLNWRIDYGRHTAASADGRFEGEPFSQNTGASFGADKNGSTAHILSFCNADYTNTANGSVLDLDLHQSAVKGEDGLVAFESLLSTFEKKGGFSMHINVLNVQTLKEAQKNPGLYPNLQIRLCGWNVLFNNLSKDEQTEFIYRAENLQ